MDSGAHADECDGDRFRRRRARPWRVRRLAAMRRRVRDGRPALRIAGAVIVDAQRSKPSARAAAPGCAAPGTTTCLVAERRAITTPARRRRGGGACTRQTASSRAGLAREEEGPRRRRSLVTGTCAASLAPMWHRSRPVQCRHAAAQAGAGRIASVRRGGLSPGSTETVVVGGKHSRSSSIADRVREALGLEYQRVDRHPSARRAPSTRGQSSTSRAAFRGSNSRSRGESPVAGSRSVAATTSCPGAPKR